MSSTLPIKLIENGVFKGMYSCSNAQAIPCSNEIRTTGMNEHVAIYVATPKHNQNIQEYVMDNHHEEKHTETQREYVENPIVSTPPFGPRTESRAKAAYSSKNPEHENTLTAY
jgi:hypothetical protein